MSQGSLRDRLYLSYAATHSGIKGVADERLAYQRDVRPHLPSFSNEPLIVDVGCGQGLLVAQLLADGYSSACGIDVSPEQVLLAQNSGLSQVTLGSYQQTLREQAGTVSAIIVTDVLEHLEKDEVVDLFDLAFAALVPGGVFIARSPNGAGPLHGTYQYGDFTHETVLSPRAFGQVARNAGFRGADCFACRPVRHGLKGFLRRTVWTMFESFWRLALLAETGTAKHIVTANFVGVAHKR